MTAPFPTHKQEEWRYADLDALKPVWEQFAEPVTLTVGAGESVEEVWLSTNDDVQLRRVQLALGAGAKARIFALNTAPVYGRIELELSLAESAEFELFGANIGTGLSTNEIVTNVKHIGERGRSRGEAELSAGEFIKLAREQAALLGMDTEMLKRPVNVGFSGGEKKRAEMVQMGIMQPKFAVLDETDSGLDIDALKAVGAGINRIMRAPDKGVLLITHYQRLLDYVEPDRVHVMLGGRVERSGGPELARELEREGYVEAAA